jgi:phosphomannomutase
MICWQVILQTMQGLIAYLKQSCDAEDVRQKGVVIGYDHREKGSLSSKHFAEICVSVLLSQNFRVILLEDFVPTPFVPFGITHYGCAAGIMVTASHNPKEDNGFKVYWGNGAQIIPPHDAGIAQCISENLKPWVASYNTSTAHFYSHEQFHVLTEELAEHYYRRMEAVSVPYAPVAPPLKIAYTAMQ